MTSSETAVTTPMPKGPYATTYRSADVLYLSGQGSIDPATGEAVLDGIREQTLRTLGNVEALLNSEGFRLEDLAQVTCYLQDIDDWQAMNEAYAQYMGERARPVRTAVEVARLPFGLAVEITAVAHRKA